MRTTNDVEKDIKNLLIEKDQLYTIWGKKENNPFEFELWELKMNRLLEELFELKKVEDNKPLRELIEAMKK